MRILHAAKIRPADILPTLTLIPKLGIAKLEDMNQRIGFKRQLFLIVDHDFSDISDREVIFFA